MNTLTTKRFVIRKSLIGNDVTITFTNNGVSNTDLDININCVNR